MTVTVITEGLRACAYIQSMPTEFNNDEVEAMIRGAFMDVREPDSSGFRTGHPEEAHEVCPACGNRLSAGSRVCMVCGQRIYRFKL